MHVVKVDFPILLVVHSINNSKQESFAHAEMVKNVVYHIPESVSIPIAFEKCFR